MERMLFLLSLVVGDLFSRNTGLMMGRITRIVNEGLNVSFTGISVDESRRFTVTVNKDTLNSVLSGGELNIEWLDSITTEEIEEAVYWAEELLEQGIDLSEGIEYL